MPPLCLLLLLFACAPAPIPDRHAETSAACDLPAPFVRESSDPGALPPIDDLRVQHLAYDLNTSDRVLHEGTNNPLDPGGPRRPRTAAPSRRARRGRPRNAVAPGADSWRTVHSP